MHSSLEYFDRVSAFGPSLLALSLILCANFGFTLVHIWQEWKGEKWPLYLVFGAVVGCRLPGWLGFLLFTPGLAGIQVLVGLAAYTGSVGGDGFGIFALGAILGGRIGDSIISHWALYIRGYRPNPGLSSTVLYVLEAIVILTAFRRGLAIAPDRALYGFGAGILFFAAVLPLMFLVRTLIKPWRRERWIRGKAIPGWVNQLTAAAGASSGG